MLQAENWQGQQFKYWQFWGAYDFLNKKPYAAI